LRSIVSGGCMTFKLLHFLLLLSLGFVGTVYSQGIYESFDHHTYDNETISLFTYGENVISVSQTKDLSFSAKYLTINSIDASGRITQIGKASNFNKKRLLNSDSTFVNLNTDDLNLLDRSGQLKHQFDFDASGFQLGDGFATGCLLYTDSEVYSITQDTSITMQLSIPNIKSVNQRNGMYHITTQDSILVYSSDFLLIRTYPLGDHESVINITGHLNHVYYNIYNSESKAETIMLAVDNNPLVIVGDDPNNVAQCLHSSEDYLYTATSVVYDNAEFYSKSHRQSLVSKSVRGESAMQGYDFVDGLDLEVMPVQLDSVVILYYIGSDSDIPVSGWYYSGEVNVTNNSSINIETIDLYSRPYGQSIGFFAQTQLSIDSLISPGESITLPFEIFTNPSKLTAVAPLTFMMLGANDRRFQEQQFAEVPVIGNSIELPVSGLTLTPNPVHDQFEVKGTDVNIKQATLYNQMGIPVAMDHVAKSTYSIDHLSPGVYLLQIVTDQEKILVSQLVKQ